MFRLPALWTQAVRRLFPNPLRVNGRRVLAANRINVAKSGKKMPGVKLLHQQSGSNTKPKYIMGHSIQAVSMFVHAAQGVLAVSLAACIRHGRARLPIEPAGGRGKPGQWIGSAQPWRPRVNGVR